MADADEQLDLLELGLKIGSAVNLELLQPTVRTSAILIGFVPNRSIMMTTPMENNSPIILRQGRPVVVRLLAGHTMVGFSSNVIKSCLQPFAYLHLEYPQSLAHMRVRNAKRVDVQLIAAVSNSKLELENAVTIINISKSGCQIGAGLAVGDIGHEIKMGFRVRISDKEQFVNLQAVIRSVREDKNSEQLIHGLEFVKIQDRTQQIIHAFVNQQLVDG